MGLPLLCWGEGRSSQIPLGIAGSAWQRAQDGSSADTALGGLGVLGVLSFFSHSLGHPQPPPLLLWPVLLKG